MHKKLDYLVKYLTMMMKSRRSKPIMEIMFRKSKSIKQRNSGKGPVRYLTTVGIWSVMFHSIANQLIDETS